MRCGSCGNELTLLFLSAVCDRCDGVQADDPGLDQGFIVWRSRPPGSCEYVFRREDDAERWRAAAGLDRFPVRRVASRTRFQWRRSTGSVRDIELADRLFEIFPDARHAPGPHRAHLDS